MGFTSCDTFGGSYFTGTTSLNPPTRSNNEDIYYVYKVWYHRKRFVNTPVEGLGKCKFACVLFPDPDIFLPFFSTVSTSVDGGVFWASWLLRENSSQITLKHNYLTIGTLNCFLFIVKYHTVLVSM